MEGKGRGRKCKEEKGERRRREEFGPPKNFALALPMVNMKRLSACEHAVSFRQFLVCRPITSVLFQSVQESVNIMHLGSLWVIKILSKKSRTN